MSAATGAGLDPAARRALLAELLRRKAGPVRQFPLSFAQARLWFLDRLEPGNTAYTILAALRLCGPLDSGAMVRSLGALVERHESLRTLFRVVDGEPVQVVLPPRAAPVPVEDAEVAEAEREAAALRLATGELERPFDLARGPLFRARLVRLGDHDHLLVLAMHHIVTDGWSMGVLFRELCALYAAHTEGTAPALAELPIQYADYAAWQRAHLRGEALEAQVAFWRGALAGAPALLELPLDHPRPAVQTHAGGRARFVLPHAVMAAVRATAQRLEATPFMVMLAAYKALLARCSGVEDLVVGTHTANRDRRETEGLVGFFINTLALRTRLDGDPAFTELVARVRETTIAAFSHQELPFERLVDELRVERALSHSPIVQVHFALHTEKNDAILLGPLQLALVEPEPTASQHELSFSLRERQHGLELDVEYNRDLFDRATVARLAERYRLLLEAACADASLRLSRLPLADAADRADLAGWSGEPAPYPAGSAGRLVAEAAARTPDAVAVVCGDDTLRYGEVEARANRLARHLRAHGAGRGTLVALSMERSALLPVAMLAVWKAGAAYVPIDPAYPFERRALMLADSGASLVLADAASAPGLPPGAASTLVLDALDLDTGDERAPEGEVEGDDLAYVIYTSGSTGRPKGVMVPHGGVVSFLRSMAREPGIGAADTVVAVTSLSFDIAVLELVLPLASGARLVVATREEALDPLRLAALLERSGATLMQATPATWRMLVQAGWEGRPELAVLSGGEALPPELARDLVGRGRALWNLYGPTETTIWSTVDRVERAERISLGHPIANTTLHLLDPGGRPAPAGIPGELYVGGAGVVRGYLGRPALTAERFVPDPSPGAAGRRLYRTGDLARRRHDGRLDFLGRADFQVKLRGFRIELGEVEAALEAHPGVRAAVADVREESAGDQRLVAYVVPAGTEAPAADQLRAALAERLPDYMVPTAFVVLDRLPLTPNGKVDRRALPSAAAAPVGAPHVPPRTPAEKAVASIWCEVLGRDRVGVDDNFFTVGGHSLLLAQVAARLGEWRGAEVPLLDLFRHPTVATQAAHLSEPAAAPARPAERVSARLAARLVRGAS